ncbi:MAG: T9SS type A sorting domain-containing protein, partial [Bacteroidota bacterium]
WNSAYPYGVGPTFYGVYANRMVNSINESTTEYDGTVGIEDEAAEAINVSVFPNPASDLIAIQFSGIVQERLQVDLLDVTGKLVNQTVINSGQTIAYFDVQTLYAGSYMVRINSSQGAITRKVVITR